MATIEKDTVKTNAIVWPARMHCRLAESAGPQQRKSRGHQSAAAGRLFPFVKLDSTENSVHDNAIFRPAARRAIIVWG